MEKAENERIPLLPSKTAASPKGRPRASWHLIATVGVVAFATNIQFYSSTVVNNLESVVWPWINETLQTRYGYTNVSERDVTVVWSFVVGVDRAGCVVGALLIRMMAERFGRRGSLLFGNAVTIAVSALVMCTKVANSLEILLICRFIFGASISIGEAMAAMFLTEIAPTCYRGTCGGALNIFILAADFLAFVIGLPEVLGTEELWPYAFGLCAIPAVINALFLLIVAKHESPRHLFITKHEELGAFESVMFYQAVDSASKPFIDETMFELRDEAAQIGNRLDVDQNVRVRDLLLSRKYRMPFIIALASQLVVPLSGAGIVMFFSTDIIISATGVSAYNAKHATLGIGLIGFLSSIAGLYLIERVGRRPLYMFYLFGCATCLASVALFSSFGATWSNVVVLIMLCLHPLFYGAGSTPMTVLMSELSETHVRSLVSSVILGLFYVLSMTIVFSFLSWKLAVGASASLIPFALCTYVIGIFLAVKMPETKDRSVRSVVRRCADGDASSIISSAYKRV